MVLGAESMIVAITTIIARWFKGKELSFAFGLNLTVARLGSFMALNSPSWGKSLYEYWQSPLWITVAAGVFAFICVIIYFFLDIYASKNYDLPKEGEQDAILLSDILRIKENTRWFILAALAGVVIILSFVNSDNWAIYLILLIVGVNSFSQTKVILNIILVYHCFVRYILFSNVSVPDFCY